MVVSRYKDVEVIKRDVNVRRYNRIQLARKLREVSYVSAPRLIKGYHNNPRLIK